MGWTASLLFPGFSRALRRVDVCFAKNSRFNLGDTKRASWRLYASFLAASSAKLLLPQQ